jgi:hypothetical protein
MWLQLVHQRDAFGENGGVMIPICMAMSSAKCSGLRLLSNVHFPMSLTFAFFGGFDSTHMCEANIRGR